VKILANESPSLSSPEADKYVAHNNTRISCLDYQVAHLTRLLPLTQRICHQSGPQRDQPGSGGSFCLSDEPRLLSRNKFLRHCSDPSPSDPDFATAIGVLPPRHRQRPDPPQLLAKHAPVVPGVVDQSPAGLHELVLQSRQRPVLDPLLRPAIY
jgi:hypothetical protein